MPRHGMRDRLPAVGEVYAHVQGESLKAYTAVLVAASQLPDYLAGQPMIWEIAFGILLGYILILCLPFMLFLVIACMAIGLVGVLAWLALTPFADDTKGVIIALLVVFGPVLWCAILHVRGKRQIAKIFQGMRSSDEQARADDEDRDEAQAYMSGEKSFYIIPK